MEITVKKFGGTSVAGIEKIKRIAQNLADAKRRGENIVTVVSAMGKTTDNLTRLAYKVTGNPGKREMDMLLTAGERISMSLLSIALQDLGVESISFTGSQSGIITNCNHGNARILDVKAFRIREELEKGKLVIVAGFQGVSGQKEVTTLGRGGSDTTAVALAAYLGAKHCEIYTDVDGIYTTDPRYNDNAECLKQIDYGSCIALAARGAQVIHPRAVEFASIYGIDVEVKSSFTFSVGTMIGDSEEMEERKITALTSREDLLAVTIDCEELYGRIIEKIGFELFAYQIDKGNLILFLEDKYESELVDILSKLECQPCLMQRNISCITVVGAGIQSNLILVRELLELFKEEQETLLYMNTPINGISFYIESEKITDLVSDIHNRFIETKDK